MKNASIAAVSVWVIFVVLLLIGWVMNIIDLFYSAAGEVTALFILRVLGVIIPIIGAYLGWFA
jgi:hypothetical protein